MKRLSALIVGATALAVTLPTQAAVAERGQCDQQIVTDPDDRTAIDIASVKLTSADCERLTITLTMHRPFTDAELGRWVFLMGDVGETRGCDGMTVGVFVDGRPGGGFDADSRSIGDCDNPTPPGSRVTVRRLSPRSISVTTKHNCFDICPPNGFRWQTIAYNADGSEYDWAPRLATIAWPVAPRPSELAVSSKVDGTALQVQWNIEYTHVMVYEIIERFDVQYRTGSGPWRSARSVGPTERYTEITGVTTGLTYQVRVASVANGRRSPWVTAKRLHRIAPGPPTNLQATIEGNTVTVAFDPPLDDGGNTSVRYSCWATLPDRSTVNTPCGDGSAEFALADRLPITVTVRASAKGYPLGQTASLRVTS